MITNARQYRTTKRELARLEEALRQATGAPAPAGVHPQIYAAELAALKSQVQELRDELEEYDALLSGQAIEIEAATLEELPDLLIKARIVNGWSQSELADRLGVKPQQVQRDETTRYKSANLERLTRVAATLGIQLHQKATLSVQLRQRALRALRGLGFDDEFVATRLLPTTGNDVVDGASAGHDVSSICNVFGWHKDELLGTEVPAVPVAATGGALYKVPTGRKTTYLHAYSAYAYRLACGAAGSAEALPRLSLPTVAGELRDQLLARAPISLAAILDWAWAHGVAVLSLTDKAAFHGAFWRIDGRNVIIMKQRTNSAARLMHDLLHEIYHAAQEPERDTRSVVDASDYLQSNDAEEEAATAFASDVLLDGRANELAIRVVRESRQQAPRFKATTLRVAQAEGVPVGALANHLAWVLARQRTPFPWWGVAHNLQEDAEADLKFAQELAFRHLIPPTEANADVDLLFRALRAQEV